METIQLLKPEHESCTEELQAFQWPDKSETVRDFSEQTESAGDAFEWDARKVTSDDRSIPRPVCMAWEGIQALSENLVYDLLISRDAALEDPMVIKASWEKDTSGNTRRSLRKDPYSGDMALYEVGQC